MGVRVRDRGEVRERGPVPGRPGDEVIAEVMSWVAAHLDDGHSLDAMARRAFMSRRTFIRHFRRVTGTSPYEWVLSQRIARSQELLEGSSLTVEGIALRTGFGGGGILRRHFSRIVGCTPSEYRAAVSGGRGHR